ncbi:MAG: putative lipid II flippase FtsW [Gemmatimonadaceae bacterium]|nr:putative lipid II flippase FtsW [Gemmatimonadaceae bacterium]
MSTSTVVAARDRWRMGVEARGLVIVTAALMAFGLAILYSASAFVAMQAGRGSTHFLMRQLSGMAVGMVLFAIVAKVDAERWRSVAWWIMGGALAAMLCTVLPFTKAIAPEIHGSRRFLFGGSIQPSEFAKLAVIIWTAMLVVKKGEQMRRLTKGMLPFLVGVGSLALCAALEPDLSVAIYFMLLMGVVLYAGGARVGHFVFLGFLSIPVLWSEIQRLQYVLERLRGFTDASAVHQKVNLQLQESLIAVGSGGAFGVGFGQGRQQFGFLPLPYNDFVASNVGEEWGFVGLFVLVGLFALWGFLGFRIAQQARTPFQRLVAIGLTFALVSTAFLHIGVVIGLLPTTGLTLPFISYGRSNLLLSFLMTGMLVNIGSQRERVHGAFATDPLAAPAFAAQGA